MKYKKLNEIAKVIAGQSPPSTTYNTKGEGLPFFQGKSDFEDKYPKVRNWCTSKRKKEALPGDILMSVRAPVGPVNICNQKAVIGRGIASIRPLKGVFGEYLFYFFRTHEQKIADLGTGSTFKAITQETLKKIKVPFPSKDDQIRIATLLSRVESLIAKRKGNLLLLDEFLKSTFLEMFGDPVRNKKCWNKKPLSEFCYFENGDRSSNYPKGDDILDSGILFLTSREIVNFRLALSHSKYISEEKFNSLHRGKCFTGDVLMVLRGAGLGKCCVFNGIHEKAFINAQMVILRCTENLNSVFLVEQIKNKRLFKELLKVGSGSAQPQLAAAQVKKFKVLIPPINLQNKFATIVEKTEAIKSLYHASLVELENLYAVLSQEAFKGELDLSRIPLEKVFEPQLNEDEQGSEAGAPFFPPLDREVMSDPVARKKLLRQIFEDYFINEPKRSFSFSDFWSRVEFNVLDYMDEESPPLGVEDYNQIKAWLFEHLKPDDVEQYFNRHENQIELRSKS